MLGVRPVNVLGSFPVSRCLISDIYVCRVFWSQHMSQGLTIRRTVQGVGLQTAGSLNSVAAVSSADLDMS